MLVCIIRGAAKHKKQTLWFQICCMWAGRGLSPTITQMAPKHTNTYTDTREILCFPLITFTRAMQGQVGVTTLTFIFCLQMTCLRNVVFRFVFEIFFCWDHQNSKLRSSWLGGLNTQNWITIWLSPIHIQLTGSVFVPCPRTFDPNCECMWCSGMKA